MFVCVSLNPAVDKRLRLAALRVGQVNRACKVQAAPGGKAAHVAMVLRALGAQPLWLGFVGGATGAALVEGLREMEIRAEPVPVHNSTRTNLEIIDDKEGVTEILEPGPIISSEEIQKFQERFEGILANSAQSITVTLSGSLPQGVPNDYYATLISVAHKHGSRVLLDASGEPLKAALQASPDFVKPNQEEAEWLSGSTIHGPVSAGNLLKQFLDMGADAGAISLGADGLVWRSKSWEQVLIARGPRQEARSCVGSGDASLAGFALAASQGMPPVESLRLAVSCGVANCLADTPGGARALDIARLKEEISVEILQLS